MGNTESESQFDGDEASEEGHEEFDWLANLYVTQGAFNHPSEFHGLITGCLSGGHRFDQLQILSQAMDHMGVEELDVERHPRMENDLFDFYQRMERSLCDDMAAFQLLLPDEEYALTERLDALANWVRGFLEGAAITLGARLGEVKDLQEIIRDLVEISQLDPDSMRQDMLSDDSADAREAAERDYFEVTEFVRIGVLSIYAEFNQSEPQDAGDAPAPTLH